MNESRFYSHRLNNLLHTLLLLLGLAGLLMAIGWVLGSGPALFWTMLIGFGALWIGRGLSPRLILRMYRAQPLPPAGAPGLYRLVEELGAAAELPRMPALHYLPTPLMNAFTVGSRADAAIAVTDGLLRGLAPRELAGVLAHEIGHIRHNDMWIMALADLASRMVRLSSFVGQFLILLNLPMYLFQRGTLPWLPLILLVLAPTLSALLQLALSRSREFDADLEAVRLTGDPEGLMSALGRLSLQQEGLWRRLIWPGKADQQPSLLRSHPATGERIARLKSLIPPESGSFVHPQDLPFLPVDWAPALRPARRRWHGLWY